MMLATVLLLLLGLGPANKPDYDTAHLTRRIKSIKTSDKITIDGRLEEPAWDSAPLARDFLQTEPREGEPAAETTEVQILYDNDNVYFGVRAADSQWQHIVV